MTYQEALDWLYSTQQFGIKLGLDQPRQLLRESCAFPSSKTRIIHVAGTNGKGSTCAFIDAIARASGTRTGLFTSPHLIDYTERIKVNGQDIPRDVCARYLTELQSLCADTKKWPHHPTFFELTLALAMRYFRDQQCELILLETGMGGRLDATTAVPADLAVITPIALDHSQWLGENIEQIAFEKAGIIVSDKPVLSSRQPEDAQKVIQQEASERRANLEFILEPLTGYSINLPGPHQKENAALAVAAAHALGLSVTPDVVRHALSSVSWPGRFEKLPISPTSTVILDATHNPHAAVALVKTWKEVYPNQKASVIFGAVEGKNTQEVLSIIAPIVEHFHFVPTNSPRSLTTQELVEALEKSSEAPSFSIHPSLNEALSATHLTPSPKTHSADSKISPIQGVSHTVHQLTLITGSLFLIGEAKAYLLGKSPRINRPTSQ